MDVAAFSMQIALAFAGPRKGSPPPNGGRRIVRKLGLTIVAASLGLTSAPVSSHPVGMTFESRGACEAFLAQQNKRDGERLVDQGVFDNRGTANEFFHETFACELDGKLWVLVRR